MYEVKFALICSSTRFLRASHMISCLPLKCPLINSPVFLRGFRLDDDYGKSGTMGQVIGIDGHIKVFVGDALT
jgi:hypothetical protein